MENTDTECSPTWKTRTQSAVQPGKHGHRVQSNMGNTDTECSPTWGTLTQSAVQPGKHGHRRPEKHNFFNVVILFCSNY